MQKNRGDCISKIVGIIILIVLSVWGFSAITRYGFCHNWWLKNTLWAHFLWQCTCAPGFEQSLFHNNVEVVVSACQSPEASISTDGQYMIVTTFKDNRNTSYITQLATGREKPWSYTNFIDESTLDGFWTGTLFLVNLGTQSDIKLIDVTDLTELNLIVSTASTIENSFKLQIPEEVLQAMKEAPQVIVHRSEPAILILADDLKDPSAKNYLLRYQKHYLSRKNMDGLLAESKVTYHLLTRGGLDIQNFYNLISYNKLFYDRTGDIYTLDGQKITEIGEVTGPEYVPITIGWDPNNSGVYYRLLYDYGLLAGPSLLSKKLIPGPIIKLNVPRPDQN